MVVKWLNRSAFGWGTLYLASRVEYSERNVDAGLLGCQGEGCGMILLRASELGYYDTLLLACQQHRMVVYFSPKNVTQKSRHIFSQYTPLLAQPVFVPLPSASSHVYSSTVGSFDKVTKFETTGLLTR